MPGASLEVVIFFIYESCLDLKHRQYHFLFLLFITVNCFDCLMENQKFCSEFVGAFSNTDVYLLNRLLKPFPRYWYADPMPKHNVCRQSTMLHAFVFFQVWLERRLWCLWMPSQKQASVLPISLIIHLLNATLFSKHWCID